MKTDILIIGAGAAGLMAAYTLSKAGRKVTVLEARGRIGGRIDTVIKGGFSAPAERGAEFVHGNLPVTLGLLEEAEISYSDVGFEMWQYHNGRFEQSEEFVEGWDAFLEKLNQLEQDMPIQDFIEQNFAGEKYAKMRSQITNYVSGYDTADVHDASAFALRNEWNHEDEDAQHRIERGYSALMYYLACICRDNGNDILLNAVVNEVVWKKGNVKAIIADNTVYEAAKVIFALPLGVLQAPGNAAGAIQFRPSLPEQANAIRGIGFGAVIKILLEFDEAFWKSDAVKQRTGADLSTMGFLFTEETVPTYWTQSPKHSPLLTGWLGGPPAYEKKDMSREAILELALTSLENVFGTGLKSRLVSWDVINWTTEPFTLGSYAYDKVESPEARKVLARPVQDTIYFAGEYMYDGPAIGTVEAALTSGKKVAEQLL